ncbi:MAG: hypothetical protein K6A80_02530 [Saccharofermentans sp.]|nr:hypothetical protein [Saccharofermentans sp.]
MDSISLFVSGRLCLFGEHSDWAGMYRSVNADIEKGLAIVTGIEQGTYAIAQKAGRFIMCSGGELSTDEHWECEMDSEKLLETAQNGEFFSYVAGVASYINDHYSVGGVKITIIKRDLPIGRGLSSSAAICVLVARAFNRLYDLGLSTEGEMFAAFKGELRTPSRCGRLDQACAYGIKPVLMEFDGSEVNSREIHLGGTFHWVVANLMSSKDTIKILGDLNRSFPFAENELDRKVHEALGKDNRQIVLEAVRMIEEGNAEKLGELMLRAQRNFDEKLLPASEELKAPILHSILKDPMITKWTYGAKGVGSNGDGMVQFLAKSEEDAWQLQEYLQNEKGFQTFTLTLKPSQGVRRAVIPIAGFGLRLFPATKCIKKCFMPVPDRDGIIKPALMIMLEQLVDAGIEEIALVIGRDDLSFFESFFGPVSEDIYRSLPQGSRDCERTIQRLRGKISYIFQDERKGFGHAVWLAREFANEEPVLLLLGDFLYRSDNGVNCCRQVIDAFSGIGKPIVAIAETPLDRVSNYGILHGEWSEEGKIMTVDSMVEKPDPEYASECLGVPDSSGKDKYYSTFGQYILTSDVFAELDSEIKQHDAEEGEVGLTAALDRIAKDKGLTGFVPDGRSYDFGNPEEYRNAFANYS